jgi:hypothetical protein
VCARVDACWTARVNPTEQHRADAAEHHQIAAKHRAAAQALRDTEASKCAGIEETDRDTSPFYFREDITSVQPITAPADPQRAGKSTATRSVGGRAIFRAVPGMTAEWLQRSVNCHIARASVLGHQDPAMSYCPLALKGVHAIVESTGDGFAVEVLADDEATAKEILRRMNTLVSAR